MLAQAALGLSGLDAQVSVDGADALAFLRREGHYVSRPTGGLACRAARPEHAEDGGGLETLEELRRDPRLRHLPVVMLTTSGADGDVYGSDARGANADVVKPVSFDGTLEAIRTLTAFWFTLNSTVHAQEHLAREEKLHAGSTD